jgi:cell division protein FtsW
MEGMIHTLEQRYRVDMVLLFITLSLVAFGVVMVYSSSAVIAGATFERSSFFLWRQLSRVVIGLILMMVFMRLHYRFWEKTAKFFLAVGFLFLLVVLIQKFTIGGGIRGANRWLRLGPLSFQPSEYVKFATVIYMAESLARRQDRIRDFVSGYLPHLLILSALLLMIMAQPNLGTTLAIFTIVGVMFFVGRVRMFHLGMTALASLPFLYLLIFVIGYRKERILAFLSPSEHTQGISYQVTQSLLALGSGGIFGVGLGESRQKLFFLPEPHTDFVFSIIGEELGFFGTLTILILFFAYVRRGLRIAKNAPDLHAVFLAVGLTMIVAVYAVLNVCVTVALIPTTGLPLPFISYGGSSLIFTLAATGILLNISKHSQINPLWPSEVDHHRTPSVVGLLIGRWMPVRFWRWVRRR